MPVGSHAIQHKIELRLGQRIEERLIFRGRSVSADLPAQSMYLRRRNRHEPEQCLRNRSVVAVRVRRRHATLVADENFNLSPPHFVVLREHPIHLRRRPSTGQHDATHTARRHRGLNCILDHARRPSRKVIRVQRQDFAYHTAHRDDSVPASSGPSLPAGYGSTPTAPSSNGVNNVHATSTSSACTNSV